MSVSTAAHPTARPPLRATKARAPFLSTWPGRVLVIVVAATLVGGGVLVYRARTAPAPVTYRTATVARGTVAQTVAVSGTISPAGQISLSFPVAGRLAELDVAAGQKVTAGQQLAKLDTADLEDALATAQQNLTNVQSAYNKQALGAAQTRQSLEDTKQSAATAVANAEQALAKTTATYQSAKFDFTSLTNQVRGDVTTLQTSIDSLRGSVGALLVLLQGLTTQTQDVKSATSSVTQAQVALDNAAAYSTSVLTAALADLGTAQAIVLASAQAFDDAIAAETDTTSMGLSFQTRQLGYTTASSRVSSAIDAVSAPITSAQTSTAAAQTTLNSTSSSGDMTLAGSRANLQNLLVLFTQQAQSTATTKSRITSASTALSTVTTTIGGYAAATDAVAAANASASASITAAQNAVDNLPFALQQAAASVANAADAVATAQVNLDDGTLRAPADGLIVSINGTVGQSVSAGAATAFAVLASPSAMTLHGTVSEANVTKLQLGQSANVTIDAVGATARLVGKVTAIDFVATISSGVPVYGVDVTIDTPPAAVRAGMSGTAQVIQASKSDVLTVPNLAIRTKAGTRYVQVMKNGVPTDTNVTLGITNGTVTEVVSGLAEGDVVVLPTTTGGATQQPGGSGGIPGIRF